MRISDSIPVPFFSLLLGALLSLTACKEAPKTSPDAAEKPPLRQPAAESLKASKAAALPPVTDETRAVYRWYCAQCHGVEGKGDGVNALLLTVPPRDHTKKDYLETRTDQQLYDAIRKGGLAVGRAPCMPAWGHTLDDGTIRSLVRYIRELCACEAL